MAVYVQVPNLTAMANGPLPLGFVWTPLAPSGDAPPPPVLRRQPVRCDQCGAYANRYTPVRSETGRWECVFCLNENTPTSRDYASAAGVQNSLELLESVVDWQQHVTPADRSFGDAAQAATPPVLYLIDESVEEDELSELRAAVMTAVRTLPPSTPVGIITYGTSVSAYDLSQVGVATADLVSGTVPPTAAALRPLLYGSGAYLVPVHTCLPIVELVLGALRPCVDPATPAANRDRCLGPALEVPPALVRLAAFSFLMVHVNSSI